MAEPYLGQIQIVAFNFAPRGWFLCNGQTLAIQQYTALFALIGTYYGGNGTSTFQLPNLQGRVPIHQGTGPGLSTYTIGEQGGVENVSLLYNNMPIHNHLINVTSVFGKSGNPSGLFIANTEEGSGRGDKAGNYDFVSDRRERNDVGWGGFAIWRQHATCQHPAVSDFELYHRVHRGISVAELGTAIQPKPTAQAEGSVCAFSLCDLDAHYNR